MHLVMCAGHQGRCWELQGSIKHFKGLPLNSRNPNTQNAFASISFNMVNIYIYRLNSPFDQLGVFTVLFMFL